MNGEGFKRKLTAILSADVEGYSRLMGEDEDATIQTLTAYRELMSSLIQKHRGRVVDSPGDNLLAEFGSVVDAVRCAVEIQEELRIRNAELPENRKMHFRIGINLGDVVEEGERIYGDGINIASRVESLAEGGGICISGTVYDSIKNKLSLSYESLGEHSVKNIKEPVRVYRMRIGPDAAAPVLKEKKAMLRKWQWAALAVVVILILGGVAVWHFYFSRPSIEPASVEKMAYPLPEKPSIAVLPFVNMSGDSEQEYIADGITENIITALSKIPEMFVIARTSTFTYKGKPVKVKQVSEELAVRYVLEGSVLKEGEQVRITAQLIDALSGHHLWTEQYDREFESLFDILDDITHEIIIALQVNLTGGEQTRVAAKGTDSIEAWKFYNEAGRRYTGGYTKNNNLKAREYYEKAIKADSEYVSAWVGLGWTYLIEYTYGWTSNRRKTTFKAHELAKKAVSLDDSDASAHSLLGFSYLVTGEIESAIAEGEKSTALGPNLADIHVYFGIIKRFAWETEEAITLIKKGMRLAPYYPPWYLEQLAECYHQAGRYEIALQTYIHFLERCKNCDEEVVREGTYGVILTSLELGREDEAREKISELTKSDIIRLWVYNPRLYKDTEHLEVLLSPVSDLFEEASTIR